MESFEIIKLAQNIVFVIDNINIGQPDYLNQSEIKELENVCDNAETVWAYILDKGCNVALKILGKDSDLYRSLNNIWGKYQFTRNTQIKIARGLRVLLNLNQLYYANASTETTSPILPDDFCEKGRTMKITTDVLIELLNKIGINENNSDKTKIAKLISYLTGFSENTIRQRLCNKEELTSKHKDEIEKVNKILSGLNMEISIKYNSNR